MSQVKTTIKLDGTSKVEVEGVPGADCLTASAPARNALKGERVSRTDTDEMNQATVAAPVPQKG